MSSSNSNGNEAAVTGKTLVKGTAILEKERTGQLVSRQKKFIEQFEAALMRIDNKTYSIVRKTGKLITRERLRAVPYTTQTMEAKLKQA